MNNCTSPVSDGLNFTFTAINSPDLVKKLILGPNPAKDKFEIRYSGNPAVLNCTIIDMNGRTIYKSTFNSSITVDIRKLPAGNYLIEVRNQRTKEKMTSVISKQ